MLLAAISSTVDFRLDITDPDKGLREIFAETQVSVGTAIPALHPARSFVIIPLQVALAYLRYDGTELDSLARTRLCCHLLYDRAADWLL